VVGLITRIRHHQTRMGKPMGFVSIEDLQGTIDLVVFPRTWKKYEDIIEDDRIVLVEGKVDAAGAEPKILVDTISTEFSKMVVAGETQSENILTGNLNSTIKKENSGVDNLDGRIDEIGGEAKGQKPQEITDRYLVDDRNSSEIIDESFVDEINWSDMPPPPDVPDEWDIKTNEIKESTNQTLKEPRAVREQSSDSGIDLENEPKKTQNYEVEGSRDTQTEGLNNSKILPETHPIAGVRKERPSELPNRLPSIIIPPAIEDTGDGEVRMLTVILRSTLDKTRDVLRMRRIHGLITSYPGNDRFAIHVFERGSGYLVEFPNSTVKICSELTERLIYLVGSDNIRIESFLVQ
jgi:DNA polymerase-3 subunit alpha